MEVTLSPEQMREAARAGVKLLNAETTLIPGDLRHPLATLEIMLDGIALGKGTVVSPEPPKVE